MKKVETQGTSRTQGLFSSEQHIENIHREFMNQYLFDITLPEEPTEEFFSLIPRQRAHVETLMVKGVVTSYGLAFDRSKVWVTLLAESEGSAHRILSGFPLYRFFGAKLYPLAFHHTSLSLTKVSLN